MVPDQHSDVDSISSGKASWGGEAQALGVREPHWNGSRRRDRRDWRLGGRSVRLWNSKVLLVALAALGCGVIAATLVDQLGGTAAPSGLSTWVLWAVLLGGITFALARARPAGLFVFRGIDLLWGLAGGVGLRLVDGWALGAEARFPALDSVVGGVNDGSGVAATVFAALAAPAVEEIFFRAVILVATYQIFRRAVGAVASAVTAILASSGLFILLHVAFDPLPLRAVLQLLLVGAFCALLVLFTGRVWGAVVVHMVYNSALIGLAAAGTALH